MSYPCPPAPPPGRQTRGWATSPTNANWEPYKTVLLQERKFIWWPIRCAETNKWVWLAYAYKEVAVQQLPAWPSVSYTATKWFSEYGYTIHLMKKGFK